MTRGGIRPEALDMMNAQEPLPGVMTGGQLSRRDLSTLALAGYRVILDVREPAEPRGFAEDDAVVAAGLTYVNLPVGDPAHHAFVFERVRDALRNAERDPVVVHCVSGNRVGFVLIPHLMLDRNMTFDQAIDVAKRVGLRSPQLAHIASDYVARMRQGDGT